MKNILQFTALVLSVNFLIACSSVKKDDSAQTINKGSDKVSDEISKATPVIVDVLPKSRVKKIPKRVERPALTYKQRFSGALAAHNRIRAKHNVSPLTWSDKLAKYSQQWANQLGRGESCKMYHRPGIPPYGENLYRSSAIVWSDGRREINPVTIKQVVKAWTDEERWYNYRSNRCQSGKQCGHYTQAVWKKTAKVGCAIKVCADKSQTWVCSYDPAGNYTGVRPY